MRMGLVAALCALTVSGCASDSERLDRLSTKVAGTSDGSTDQRLLAFLDDERRKPDGKGLLLMSVKASGCIAARATVEQMADGKPRHFAVISAPEPQPMPAGEYSVSNAGCGNGIGGPHARFTVRPGELVNIGTLVLESGQVAGMLLIGRGSVRRTVAPIDAERVGKLRQDVPGTMAKMVDRPMVITGPEEVGTRMIRRGAM